MNPHRANVSDMDSLIQNELKRLGGSTLGAFPCKGAFLFLHDAFGHTLEPAFCSLDLSYEQLSSVTSTTDQSRQDQTGIASIAFWERRAFSREPKDDERIRVDARHLRELIGGDGSMMAIALDAEVMPESVIVVFAPHVLGLSTFQEQQALNAFESETLRLRMLLQQRRAIAAEIDVNRYERLVLESVAEYSQGRTINQLCTDAADRIAALFNARTSYIGFQHHLDSQTNWYPHINSEQAISLSALLGWNADADRVALNRARIAPIVHQSLADFGTNLAWSRVRVVTNVGILTCCISRVSESFSDLWSSNDVSLLSRTLELLALKLKRALKFEELIDSVGMTERDEQRKQFRLWYHLLDGYFGIDQVLITKVCQKLDHYVVKTQLHAGFSTNGHALVDSPKKYIHEKEIAEMDSQPDIMVRILSDFLNSRRDAENVYKGCCEKLIHDRFSLDGNIINKCQLKGEILFVPCYFKGEGKGDLVLRSIMHLGSSSGQLRVTEKQYPLLLSLGNRVAEWLTDDDRRKYSDARREILDVSDSSMASIENICQRVFKATNALGTSLFTNALHLGLIGLDGPRIDDLENLFAKFLRRFKSWPEFIGEVASTKITNTFSEFLGVDFSVCHKILSSLDTNELARVVAHACYVRTVMVQHKSSAGFPTSGPEVLCKLCQIYQGLSSKELVIEFGTYFASNCYLPGSGLTGWVIRYHRQMILEDKLPETIKKFTDSLSPFPVPSWRFRILQLLRQLDVGVETSFLNKEPYYCPKHANIVPEHRKSGTSDTFVAIPIEGFTLNELPAGVLRLTGKNNVGQLERELVEATSRHLANIFRTEHMRQKSYIETVLRERGDETDARHMFKRLDEGIGRLRENAGRNLEGDVRTKGALTRLQEICDTALARDEHVAIALDVRHTHHKVWKIEEFASILRRWLVAVKLSVDVKCLEMADTPFVEKEVVIDACRTAEEILKNLRRHQDIKEAHALITIENGPKILLGNKDIGNFSQNGFNWLPYGSLSRGKTAGGGTRVLLEVQLASNLEVEYRMEQCINSSELDEKETMIARISLPSLEAST